MPLQLVLQARFGHCDRNSSDWDQIQNLYLCLQALIYALVQSLVAVVQQAAFEAKLGGNKPTSSQLFIRCPNRSSLSLQASIRLTYICLDGFEHCTLSLRLAMRAFLQHKILPTFKFVSTSLLSTCLCFCSTCAKLLRPIGVHRNDPRDRD